MTTPDLFPETLPAVLPEPTPAEVLAYDQVVVAFSGGKDSVACVLRLFDLGVRPDQIELWHHIVDGREGSDLMDWPVTNAYCRAFADRFGLPLYFTWKEGGFEREMLREDARTAPIHFECPVGEPRPGGPVEVRTTGGTRGQLSTRRAFPQVSADLSVRWCSAYLKIDNARTALRNQPRFDHSRTLFVSGERAEESPGRARYALFEPDDTDLRDSPKKRRHVDRWRPVHGMTEAEVWALIEGWRVVPHPAYLVGWSRCSCAACIFNGADEFATLRAIAPERFARLPAYERAFGRTMKRDRSLDELADAGTPMDARPEHVRAALSATYDGPIQVADWEMPAGAFRGGGGPS